MTTVTRLLFLAAFFNALSWIILIPIWQYPDEQAHFAQVQNLAELGYLPKKTNDTSYEIALSEQILGTQRDGFGNNKFTYHPEYKIEYSDSIHGLLETTITDLDKSSRIQFVKRESTFNPPLYYFLGSIFYRMAYAGNLFNRVYSVRIMSLLIFMGSVFLSFKIGQLIFENEALLPMTLVSFVAFKPMLVFASTGVLPDTLTNFLFTTVLFFCLKIIKAGFETRTIILLVLTVLFGVLTRQQFLISVFIILTSTLYQAFKKFSDLRWIFASIVIFLVLFYFSNTILISTPFFTHLRVPEIFDAGFLGLRSLSLTTFIGYFGWALRHTFSEVWPWYWGVYRWLSFTLPPIYYQIINRLVIISLIGLAIKIFLIVKNREIQKQDIYISFLVMASLVYFLILTVWDYLFWLKNGFSFGIQGRYFFPLVVAHMTILLVGLKEVFLIIFKKYAKLAILALPVLMIIFNNLSLFHLAASYYDTSNLTTFIVQASQYKPYIIKGNILSLILLINFLTQIILILRLAKLVVKNS